jgi:hypothetical protein
VTKNTDYTIHVDSRIRFDVQMAWLEKLFEMEGPDYIARLLADRLRQPKLHKDILETITRMLDGNTSLQLVVTQSRKGERWRTRVNNFAIVQAIKRERARGKAYGMVKRLATKFHVNPDKVKKLGKRLK